MKIGNLEVYGIIYKITNIINGKVYIGQTIQEGGFDARYKGDLKENTHNEHLKRSIFKYGIENFKINKIYDIAFSKEELDIKECLWISIYHSNNKKFGYNKTSGGSQPKFNIEIKNKISKSRTGIVPSQESKLKNSLNHKNRKKVILITTNEIFNCVKDAERLYNVANQQIIRNCKHKRHSAGKLEDGTPLIWMYYDEYMKITDEELKRKTNISEKYKNYNKYRKIICLTTKIIFNQQKEACSYYNISSNHITDCCLGTRNYCGKLNDGTKLEWMYYDEYILKYQQII